MGKHYRLFGYLCHDGDLPVELRLVDIERLVGPAPASSTTHLAWWADEPNGGSTLFVGVLSSVSCQVESVDHFGGRRFRFPVSCGQRGS